MAILVSAIALMEGSLHNQHQWTGLYREPLASRSHSCNANVLVLTGEDAHAYLSSDHAAQIQDLVHRQNMTHTQAALAAINARDTADKLSAVQRAQLVLLAAGANYAQDSAAAWGAYANFLHTCIPMVWPVIVP